MNQELQQIQEKSQTRLQRMLDKANFLVQNTGLGWSEAGEVAVDVTLIGADYYNKSQRWRKKETD